METMAISEFKAHALMVLDQISRTKVPIIITKRGKPLAQVNPIEVESEKMEFGKLADTLLFEEDIVSPLGEDMWEVTQ